MVAQLVGTALMVFVKSELTSVIRNVEGTTRKVCLVLRILTPHVQLSPSLIDGVPRDVRE